MPVEIPLDPTLAAWSQTTPLDGVSHRFRFWFNKRMDAWYLDIFAADGSPQVRGQRMVLGWNILRRHQAGVPSLPAGMLLVQAFPDDGVEPQSDDLGSRIRLWYYSAAEVAALIPATISNILKIEAVP